MSLYIDIFLLLLLVGLILLPNWLIYWLDRPTFVTQPWTRHNGHDTSVPLESLLILNLTPFQELHQFCYTLYIYKPAKRQLGSATELSKGSEKNTFLLYGSPFF